MNLVFRESASIKYIFVLDASFKCHYYKAKLSFRYRAISKY